MSSLRATRSPGGFRALWDRLRPSERLTILTLLALLGLTLLARPDNWPMLLAVFGGLFVFIGMVASGRVAASWSWVRDFAPVAAVLGTFLFLQPLVAALNAHRWDGALAAADARWFGALVRAWQGLFGRHSLFTDLAYLAYASFYFLPLAVAGLIRARSGSKAFERASFILLLGFYLSFLGYFLWPAEGPRVPEAMEGAWLGGGALSRLIRSFLRAAESTTLDAFPSGHTALSVLPAALASRAFGWKAWPFWLWAAAILFSTVYLSLHYVVDLFAGLGVAASALLLAGPARRFLGGMKEV